MSCHLNLRGIKVKFIIITCYLKLPNTQFIVILWVESL